MVKSHKNKEVWGGFLEGFIVFVFVLGFFVLNYVGGSYTGYTGGNITFSIPENESNYSTDILDFSVKGENEVNYSLNLIETENSYGKIVSTYRRNSDDGVVEYFIDLTNYLQSQNFDFAISLDEDNIIKLNSSYMHTWNGTDWVDRTGVISGEVYNNENFFVIDNVHFDESETKQVKVVLDVVEGSSGKFDLWIKRSSDSLFDAIQNNLYVHIDPIWFGSPAGTQWGSAFEPVNNSRTIDDRSIDFIFNVSATGIHNQSNFTSHCPASFRFERDSAKDYANKTIYYGTLTGNPINTSGIVGYAYEFDGDGDYVYKSVSQWNNVSNGTISAWIKRNQDGVQQAIFSSSDEGGTSYWLFFDVRPTNVIAIEQRNSDTADVIIGDTTISVGQWYHVAVTTNGTDYKLYVNGNSEDLTVSSGANNGDWLNSTQNRDNFAIGALVRSSVTIPFNGSIDEVIIWNRTLTSGEISQIYNDTLSGETRTINNCSLLLNIDNAGYTVNTTYNDTVFHNQSNFTSHCPASFRFERDSAKNYANGTTYYGGLNGDIQNTTGIVGYAYEFDGDGDYIGGITQAMIEDYTMCAWVKFNAINTDQRFLAYSRYGYGFIYDTPYGIYANLRAVTGCGGTDDSVQLLAEASANTNQWYHVCLTLDNSTTTLTGYFNGEATGTDTDACNYHITNDITIGAYYGDTIANEFNGTLDEVIIWNRTLTSGEISQLYNDTNDKINFEGYNTTIDVDFAHCYDSETEILTDEGWKFFKDLDKTEGVMTLNTKTGETVWQKPKEYQTYDYDGEMYRIKTSRGDLLVSPEHKIYSKVEEKNISNSLSFKPSSFNKSLVEYTGTELCFLNLGSLDQSEQFSESASANGGISLSCGANCLALDSNSLYDSEDITFTYFSNSLNANSISSLFDLEYFKISDSLSFNSSKEYADVNNCNLNNSEFSIKYLAGDLLLKNVNNTLVSTTNFIYHPSFLCFSQTALLTFLPNFSATSSVSSEFSNILSNFLSNSNFLTLCESNSLIITDQLTSGNFSISCFNGSDIDNVTFGILIPPHNLINTQDTQIYKDFYSEDYELIRVKDVYSSFNSGNIELFFLGNGEEILVEDIVLEEYNGKIYDVDVPEYDVILVRRRNEKATEVTSWVTGQVTETGTVLGLSNCTDFDGLLECESGEFGGYSLCSSEFEFDEVSEIGMGDISKKPSYLTVFSGNSQHDINWKIQCYDDLDIPWNSSEMYFELDALVTSSQPNIGAHAFVDENYVVGSWRFEQVASGNDGVFDETGINNATLINGPKWCPDDGDSQKYNCSGRVGKGIMFDGINDNLQFISSSGLNANQITMNAWVYPVEDKGLMFIGGDGNTGNAGYWLGSSTGNNLRGNLGNGTDNCLTEFNVAGLLTLNQWHFVSITSDGDTGRLYHNGIEKATCDLDGVLDYTGVNPYIGNIQGLHADRYWNGTIDEVTIWNRSLSSEEVKQLYYMSNSTFTIQDISASNNLTEDEDNDTIKFIYDWYVNNESMAVLNMPFEAVNNGSEMNFSKDYSDNENHGKTNFNSDVYYGAVNDSSGWNRTGGYDGFGAYEFDGDGDYVNVPYSDSINVTGAITLSAWIYNNVPTPSNDFILGKGISDLGTATNRDYDLTIQATSKPVMLVSDGTDFGYATATNSIAGNRWYHIVGTWDGTSNANGVKIYVNGIVDGQGTASFTASQGKERAFRIGTLNNLYEFNGTIDEVLIFNRSLSAEQIKALYYNQTQTIKSQETVKGQSWKAEVTANDGYGDSIEYNTSEIIIDSVTLNVKSLAPNNDTTITCLSSVNFTYNVTDGASVAGIQNCSLYLGYNTANANVINSSDNVIENNQNQTFNLTMTVNGTWIYWKVGCYDKDEEQTNSSLRKFYLNPTCPPHVPQPHPGSSSGMGSSGDRQASRITETKQTILGNVYTLDYITPGVTVLEISDPALSVYKIELDISRELEDVGVEISEGKTAFVKKPKDRVYRYIEVNGINLPDSAVNEIIFYFKVQKGFADEINLMHYKDEWYRLETSKINEDEYYEYYKGRSNSLSMFAINGKVSKKSLIQFFTPGLIEDEAEITGFSVREYVGVSILSVIGLVFMIILFMVVRARLKRRKK